MGTNTHAQTCVCTLRGTLLSIYNIGATLRRFPPETQRNPGGMVNGGSQPVLTQHTSQNTTPFEMPLSSTSLYGAMRQATTRIMNKLGHLCGKHHLGYYKTCCDLDGKRTAG